MIMFCAVAISLLRKDMMVMMVMVMMMMMMMMIFYLLITLRIYKHTFPVMLKNNSTEMAPYVVSLI